MLQLRDEQKLGQNLRAQGWRVGGVEFGSFYVKTWVIRKKATGKRKSRSGARSRDQLLLLLTLTFILSGLVSNLVFQLTLHTKAPCEGICRDLPGMVQGKVT